MPLIFQKGDITTFKVDAIVNAANNSLLGGGGVDGCIHRAAGPELLRECETLGGCATGKAKITRGYRLPAKFVIHTVGPVWRGGSNGEEDALTACYLNSLKLAVENKCSSVAFPLISAGAYGYPKKAAFDVAVKAINEFLEELNSDLTVYIVFYDKSNKAIRSDSLKLENFLESGLSDKIAKYIEDRLHNSTKPKILDPFLREPFGAAATCALFPPKLIGFNKKLTDFISTKGDTFSEKLLKLIEESGMSNSKCYSLANVSRQLFSKIISKEDYTPKKTIVLAFAIALKLSLAETESLLKSAGLALSDNNRFDLIVQYFIENKEYDIWKINEILMEYGEPQLGSNYR